MPSWLSEFFILYRQKPVLVIALLGFAAGLPYLLVFSTLTAWLRDSGVELSAIGLFAWVGITYSVKVFWSPVVDRVSLPWLSRLGQRRSWMLLGQLGIMAGLYLMSTVDPKTSLGLIAVAAVLVAFSSSTQDIALDAFRIESAPDTQQGAMSAAYIFGYRLALLVAGAGALYIADYGSWSLAYLCMAMLMLIGISALLWADEPAHKSAAERQHDETQMVNRILGRDMKLDQRSAWQRWLLGAVICPFLEFFQRNGKFALLILVFIALYRISDITMGIMAMPFYLDLGYSKSEIASIAKVFGFAMTIAGAVLCGFFVARWGVMKPLMLGAILVAVTNLLFVLLANVGAQNTPSVFWLGMVISADNLCGGIANTAFVAYLSSLANRHYTATQYALFSSLMTLPGKFLSGFSGWVVEGVGYAHFFLVSGLLGIPAIILVWVLIQYQPQPSVKETSSLGEGG